MKAQIYASMASLFVITFSLIFIIFSFVIFSSTALSFEKMTRINYAFSLLSQGISEEFVARYYGVSINETNKGISFEFNGKVFWIS